MTSTVSKPSQESKASVTGVVKALRGLQLTSDQQPSFRLSAKENPTRRQQNPNASGNCSSDTLFLAEADEHELSEFEASMPLAYTPESESEDDDDVSATVLSDTSDEATPTDL